MAVPRNREQHSAVAGVWNHNRAIALQEARFENEVNALAGDDHRSGGGFRVEAKRVAESPGGVDHDFSSGSKFVAGFDVTYADAIHESLSIFCQSGNFDVVQQRCALLESRGDHMDKQPGVVELSVVINGAAT